MELTETNDKKETFSEIDRRIGELRSSITAVCGESPYHKNAALMAVTKTVDPDRINYAIDHCGIRCIGENRVQELCEKYPFLHLDGVAVHLIGTLQTNKVKYIIDKADMIQSLDSLSLAKEIDRQAEKHGKIMDCLIEINIGREPTKGGILPEDLFPFYDAVSVYPHLRVRGLMTIAPNTCGSDSYLRYFGETKALFDRLCHERLTEKGVSPLLSMGMSGSYREAILCGTDLVRIGSGIFGARPAPVGK